MDSNTLEKLEVAPYPGVHLRHWMDSNTLEKLEVAPTQGVHLRHWMDSNTLEKLEVAPYPGGTPAPLDGQQHLGKIRSSSLPRGSAHSCSRTLTRIGLGVRRICVSVYYRHTMRQRDGCWRQTS
ncbi:hypothetical protein TNCV_1480191 [Trichonephila clavipes]|nr:hypothetical protein TNCV_1480191 [Trichonephila clavipes]